MKLRVSLLALLLAAIALGPARRGGTDPRRRTPRPVDLTYRGGLLVPAARVVTLFWGSNWSGSPLPAYFNGFFRTLFADGRYMGNLAQYGIRGHEIGNGTLAGTLTDTQQPSAKLRDAQIQAEIRAQVSAGHLPRPDQNTTYVVFTPPGVEVFDRYGDNSLRDFYSYHDYANVAGGFPYIVIAYDDTLDDPRKMTIYASHELAEAVTDPVVTGSDDQLGWYDDHYGEVADIVATFYDDGLIGDSEYAAELDGADGSSYWVQKFWSVRDSAPVGLER
jgi:hypothetical protein